VDIPTDSPAYREEFFGPVASMFRVAGAAEAIRLANDSRFGFGANIAASCICSDGLRLEKSFAVFGIVAASPRAFSDFIPSRSERLAHFGCGQAGYVLLICFQDLASLIHHLRAIGKCDVPKPREGIRRALQLFVDFGI